MLYFLAGKLGLSLAVPPGYATVIWPPSGIALGMLLAHGRGLAPGVFLGSFLLNMFVGHAPTDLPTLREIGLASGIATGSTLQALLGHALIARWFGVPVRLRQTTDVVWLLVVAIPLACLVSASMGVASLYAFGGLAGDRMFDNWSTWWTGDMFGVLVFLPLTLLISGRNLIHWRDRPMRGTQSIGLVLLVLPLGLTFYAWKSLSETHYRQSQSQFETLVNEGEQALNTRLAAYAGAIRSGSGVLQSSVFVSQEEWRTFLDVLRLREDYPGMLGLGWIDGDRVTYLEPESIDGVAVGLNIQTHPGIREAAQRASRLGAPTLTSPLLLGRDENRAPGFLLLQPVYRANLPLGTPEQRRDALRGFVFAPFQARGLFTNLTPSLGRRLDVSLEMLTPDANAGVAPIFGTPLSKNTPRFSLRREHAAFGAGWQINWQSTAEFERTQYAGGAHFVLFGGLLFTGLFAVLLVVFGARRQLSEPDEALTHPWLMPVATFALVAGGSFAAYALLSSLQDAQVIARVETETRRLEAELDRTVVARLQAVRRMAHRWSSGGGTPYVVWRGDAQDMVRQIDGLEQLQWIGSDFHVHWAEGSRRRGWVQHLDARSDAGFARQLQDSADRGLTLVTAPLEFAPGESAFNVYVPVTREGRFDGFLVATFSSREFFGDAREAVGKAFTFSVQYDGRSYLVDDQAVVNAHWSREGGFKVQEQNWSFTVSPTKLFVAEQKTALPRIVLIAGLLIALLAAFLVRYVQMSKLKAARLQASARALAASEQRYELALRGMSVGLWDWNMGNNDLFLSQRCKDMLCVTRVDFVPKYTGFLGRLHPDDKARVEKMLFGHLKQQNAFDVEFRMRRDDDEYIWVHIFGQAQYDADGQAVRMAGSIQDISIAKQQEQDLIRSGAQLRLLVENTPASVAMFDKDMRYIMTSNRFMQDYGLEGRDIIGKCHYDVFPEIRNMPNWLDVHRRAMRGERFDNREDSWIRADGQKQYNQWAIHPWMDSEGNVGGIVMFTEEITARKIAEEALRASEAMNRAAMDKAPIGKAMVSPDGRFLKVNPALCQLLGYTEQELLAMDFQTLTHPDDLALDMAQLQSLLEARSVSYQMEKRYFHRDGRVIWVQLSVSLVRRADGEVDFLVSQLQDITGQKLIDRTKDQFVSMVSQELRQPISSIRDSLGEIAAAQSASMPDSLRRQFDTCQRNCDQLGRLVEEILDLEKITAGQMRFDFKDEQIAVITRQAISVNAAYARITVADIDPELIVYVDTARYNQVLSNLLSNAVKFSPPGSPIEVSAGVQGDWVRIYVRDQGEGIPDEFRARIFGKFERDDSLARQKGGAGLGLYITRQLVEQMRGKIGFVSQVGVGSTFWLEFPRVSRGQHRLTA